jgi:tetratricopeptide (TPR) repeat protein
MRIGVLLVGVIAFACTPPEPERPAPRLVTHVDSVLDSVARMKGPEWRSLQYPIASIHGPYARPAVADTEDANDPLSYYRLGERVRYAQPGLADRALYWATRLDPTFADAYFARWRLLRQDIPWREMPDGSIRRVFALQPAAAVTTDSLLSIAIAYSPFLDGTVDVPRWIINLNERRASSDPIVAGMRHYGLGNYREATADWAKALKKEPKAVMLHIPRAYAWVKLDETDSAIGDLTALAKRIESIEKDSVIAPYYSKVFLYYAIGMLHAHKGRMAEARAAYEQALLENLGFYMAHVRLGAAAAILHDTTTALSELQTAILIRPDDPLVLIYDGSLLLQTGHVAEADEQFRAAWRADSDYAMPYAMLGMAAEARHDTAAARQDYAAYLERAARRYPERQWVRERLTALGGPLGARP